MAATSFLTGEVPHREVPHASNLASASALPNRERLSPNQNLWAATTKKMGVRSQPKRRQRASPATVVPSSTSEHIGSIGVKRKLLFTDAYNGGEQSGKRAKPDAASVAANAHARGIGPQ